MKTTIIKCVLFVIAAFHLCTVQSCNTTEFTCTSGECIDIGRRCDNDFNCGDRTDEENCTAVQICPEGRQKCDTGECVVDINLCSTHTTMMQLSTSIVEPSSQSLISPTNTFEIQSNPSKLSTYDIQTTSTYDIQPTSSRDMPANSVIYTTIQSVQSVKTPTSDSKFKPICKLS
ncbi:low-density lipoprotein receptor-like [Mytilus trossulus]|uniref:low-density lipoprotein receptor-like n=1 Tax=Mytilus trossulus TaxID=6551 RepID=UPI0030043A99